MIGVRELVYGVPAGVLLIAFGLTPGLLDRVADGFHRAMEHTLSRPSGRVFAAGPSAPGRRVWLATAGMAIVAGTAIAYLLG
jgi:hypothetical protein